MKTFLFRFTCVLLLFSAPITRALANNVLSNPGFEFDPIGETGTINGWNSYGYNVLSETGTNAHAGTNFFKVYQEFTSQINYSGIYQDYISAPGMVYAADGWAFTLASDKLAGQNNAWIEVTFRDAQANILSLYRSALISTNIIGKAGFPLSTWVDLSVTNQYDPGSYIITNTTSKLAAPAGTVFVRYQIVLQGDAANTGGSVYFDDLTLNPLSGLPYGNMNIVWSDEFNGTALDTNTWTFDTGNGGSNPGWGNNELEYYTSTTNNALVSGGSLNIIARKQTVSGFDYTSARIKSLGLFSFTYGRLEWRAQLPQGVGTWPALWMMGANINTVPWPGCGEIDVMENSGTSPGMVQGSLHSGSDETGIYNFTDGNSAVAFHKYTLDWTSNAILFYVDGHLYETQTAWSSSTGNAYPYPFNQPFFLLMNLAIGGNYVGNPSESSINSGTAFPVQIKVDYVRIYTSTDPLMISTHRSGTNLVLTWPTNIVCHLQSQTVGGVQGIGTNWITVATTNNQLTVAPTGTGKLYRLVSP